MNSRLRIVVTTACTLARLRRTVGAVALAALLGAPPATCAEDVPTVLVISSFAADLAAHAAFSRGLTRGLESSAVPVEVHYEFLNAVRLPDPLESGLVEHLERRYRDESIEFLVFWGSAAQRVATARPDWFPEAKRLYLDQVAIAGNADAAGEHLSIQMDPALMLDSILALTNPDELVVVGTTDRSGQARLDMVRTALDHRAENELRVTQVLDRPIRETAAFLEDSAFAHSAVLYLLVFDDGFGRAIAPALGARLLAERSAAPVFSPWSSLIGSGVVGGAVLDMERSGNNVAQALLAMNAQLPVPAVSSMSTIYDWQALDHWQLSEDRIPQGAVVINRAPDLFEMYFPQVVGATGAFMFLGALTFVSLGALRRRNALIAALTAAQKEIEALQEILPMCSYCRRVQDHADHWHSLEDFVQRASGADFSHGICPSCMPSATADAWRSSPAQSAA